MKRDRRFGSRLSIFSFPCYEPLTVSSGRTECLCDDPYGSGCPWCLVNRCTLANHSNDLYLFSVNKKMYIRYLSFTEKFLWMVNVSVVFMVERSLIRPLSAPSAITSFNSPQLPSRLIYAFAWCKDPTFERTTFLHFKGGFI